MLEVMAELSAEGMTSMVVTHEMGFARRAANKILFMEDGEIIDRANTSDFFAGHVSDRAQRFPDANITLITEFLCPVIRLTALV